MTLDEVFAGLERLREERGRRDPNASREPGAAAEYAELFEAVAAVWDSLLTASDLLDLPTVAARLLIRGAVAAEARAQQHARSWREIARRRAELLEPDTSAPGVEA